MVLKHYESVMKTVSDIVGETGGEDQKLAAFREVWGGPRRRLELLFNGWDE